MKFGTTAFFLCCFLSLPLVSQAALPLITDDAGTQGARKFQLEAAAEYDHDRETSNSGTVTESDYLLGGTLTYGITDTVDLFIGAPYTWVTVSDDAGFRDSARGINDTVVGAKWRFLEQEGFGLALKPFITLPTGNDEKALGTGKIDYGAVMIVSQEAAPWAFYANLGYTRNENLLGERKDLWQLSAAVVFTVTKNLKIAADIGAVTNTDKTSENEPRYLLAGVIYSLTENLDLSLGIKNGLDREETDWSVSPGVTYRF